MTTPRATYRLQFREGMTFDRAVAIVPYLKRLGISHLYASPIFTAPPGSTHGYDVANHNEIDSVLGGRDGFDRLSQALQQAGLGLILDIVPNHMAASLDNPWWRDVVEWGERSAFGRHFDIDWRERLTLPILGRAAADAVAAGEITLRLDRLNSGLALGYFDTLLPLTPPTYAAVLSRCDHPLAAAILRLAQAATPDGGPAMHDRIRTMLADDEARARLDACLADLSSDHAFVEQILAMQPWRLMFWKEARRHLSYRRFFEVTGLVGVRVEDPAVFDDVHALVLDLVRSGKVDGLRIDHVDGLADPAGYLARLRQEVGPDIHLTVEKILARDETLPPDWPIAGTTGYEFIATMADIFVDTSGVRALERLYASNGGCSNLEQEKRRAKHLMVCDNFETELSVLTGLATETGRPSAPGADAIRAAIIALVVAFPVYRTYATDRGMPASDRVLLDRVAKEARDHDPTLDADALDAVLALLSGDGSGQSRHEFRRRFQQLTGPVMAKAVEDTLFYRCNAMLALNEVGSDPSDMAASVSEAHARLAACAGKDPPGLLATATHDTKRGEDARARLYSLSEAPATWGKGVERWRAMNAGAVQPSADGPAPEPQVEWLLYQALAGVWPGAETIDDFACEALSQRFQPYVEKALREAKLRTDWADVNDAYESAVKAYAVRLLAPENRIFLDDFSRTLAPFVHAGAVNSLAQTLIKLTAPGIPDIYQGTEGEDLSLVDPDNRLPVDFDRLARRPGAMSGAISSEDVRKGTAKQGLIARCLAWRAAHETLFSQGDYIPLRVSGPRRDNVFAFERRHGGARAIVTVPRLVLSCQHVGPSSGGAAFWADTALHVQSDGLAPSWVNVLGGDAPQDGETIAIADLFNQFPVGMIGTG